MVQIKNVDPDKLIDNLKVGSYMIQNFEVERNASQYKAIKHGLKITLFKGTKINEQESLNIPMAVYNFTMFDDMLDGKTCPNFLIGMDIIVSNVLRKYSLDHIYLND